jgi:hypothetical protein
VLNRDAPLYAIYRGARNLRALINSMKTSLSTMSDLAQDRLLVTTTVDSDALAASKRNLALYGSSMDRRGINATESVPPLGILNDQLDKALDSLRDGIGTDTSPDEARTLLASELASFQELEDTLDTNTELLVDALTTYLGINLQGAGILAISDRAERLIEEIETSVNDGSVALKDASEDLIAIQTTVNELAQVPTPDKTIVSGTGAAAGTGTVASLETGESGPWDFTLGSHDLDVAIDGASATSFTLPDAVKATAITHQAQTYGFLGGSGDGWKLGFTTSNEPATVALKIRVDGAAPTTTSINLYYDPAENGGVPPRHPYVERGNFTSQITAISGITTAVSANNIVSILRDVVGVRHGFNLSANNPSFTVVVGVADVLGGLGLGDCGEYTVAPLVVIDCTYRGISITVDDVIETIRGTTNLLNAERTYTEFYTGRYGYIPSINKLEVYKIKNGSGLSVTAGSRVVTTTAHNFEARQVKVGDLIKFDSQIFGIVAVAEESLTIDADHTSSTGTYSFDIYPDTTVLQAGDIVDVRDQLAVFSSEHKISSISEGEITIVDNFFMADLTTYDVDFTIFRDNLTIRSTKTDTTSSLEVEMPASTANTHLDFPTGEVRGTVEKYEDTSINFSDYSILINDRLQMSSPAIDEAITAINSDLTLENEIINDASGAYSVINPDRDSHDTFIQSLISWRTTNLDYYEELDSSLNAILNDDPTQGLITAFQNKVVTISATYDTLLGYITALTARRLVDIDDTYSLLLEAGFDRARDVLITCDFASFFSMTSQEATYEGYVQKESQEFVSTYLQPDKYVDPHSEELQEFILPDIKSEELGE